MPEAGAGADLAERRREQCELFNPRVTVARDSAHPNGYNSGNNTGNGHVPASNVPAPKSANDARAIFDSLFKKPD